MKRNFEYGIRNLKVKKKEIRIQMIGTIFDTKTEKITIRIHATVPAESS